MRIKLPAFIVTLFTFFFLVSSVHAIAGVPGTPTADPHASYTPKTANVYYDTSVDGRLCQKFTPSKTIIANYIDIRAAGSNTNGATLTLYSNSGGNPGSSLSVYSPPASFNDGRNTMSRFTADSYLVVTPNDFYWICLNAPAINPAYWYADNPGTYAGMDGVCPACTFWGGFLMNGVTQKAGEDYGFIIYSSEWEYPGLSSSSSSSSVASTASSATSVTTSSVTSAVSSSNSSVALPVGVTLGNGAAPVTPTTSIKQPTSVTIIDVPSDQGDALKLEWKASVTTDIDGYKVFRSTDEKTNYKEVAKVLKSIVTYTDNSLSVGQKYYYQVRAYKTTKESTSSDTVSGISIDNVAPLVPTGFTYVKTSASLIDFTWNKNAEGDLQGYLFTINQGTTVVESFEFIKEVNTFALDFSSYPKLISGTEYTYQLLAKDTHNNKSGFALGSEIELAIASSLSSVTKSAVASSTGTSPVSIIVFIVIVIFGFVVFAGLAVLSYVFVIKKKLNAVKKVVA